MNNKQVGRINNKYRKNYEGGKYVTNSYLPISVGKEIGANEKKGGKEKLKN